MGFHYLPHAVIVAGAGADDGVYLDQLPLPTLVGTQHIGHIRTLVAEYYPDIPPEQHERITQQIWYFVTELLLEDILLIPSEEAGKLACCEITGSYRFIKDAAGRTLHGYPAIFRAYVPAHAFSSLTDIVRAWTVCLAITQEKQQFMIKKTLKLRYKFSPKLIKIGALILLFFNLLIISIRYWNYYQGKL